MKLKLLRGKYCGINYSISYINVSSDIVSPKFYMKNAQPEQRSRMCELLMKNVFDCSSLAICANSQQFTNIFIACCFWSSWAFNLTIFFYWKQIFVIVVLHLSKRILVKQKDEIDGSGFKCCIVRQKNASLTKYLQKD